MTTSDASGREQVLEAVANEHYRSYQRVCQAYNALIEQVTTALSTPEHHHTMQGGMPYCACWHSLRGDEGLAHEVLIEHLLDVVRIEREAASSDEGETE